MDQYPKLSALLRCDDGQGELKSFLQNYHQRLHQELSFPPLKLGKSLHIAAKSLGYKNWHQVKPVASRSLFGEIMEGFKALPKEGRTTGTKEKSKSVSSSNASKKEIVSRLKGLADEHNGSITGYGLSAALKEMIPHWECHFVENDVSIIFNDLNAFMDELSQCRELLESHIVEASAGSDGTPFCADEKGVEVITDDRRLIFLTDRDGEWSHEAKRQGLSEQWPNSRREGFNSEDPRIAQFCNKGSCDNQFLVELDGKIGVLSEYELNFMNQDGPGRVSTNLEFNYVIDFYQDRLSSFEVHKDYQYSRFFLAYGENLTNYGRLTLNAFTPIPNRHGKLIPFHGPYMSQYMLSIDRFLQDVDLVDLDDSDLPADDDHHFVAYALKHDKLSELASSCKDLFPYEGNSSAFANFFDSENQQFHCRGIIDKAEIDDDEDIYTELHYRLYRDSKTGKITQCLNYSRYTQERDDWLSGGEVFRSDVMPVSVNPKGITQGIEAMFFDSGFTRKMPNGVSQLVDSIFDFNRKTGFLVPFYSKEYFSE